MGARRRSLPDDDVQLVVFESGVEFFFEHRLHAVNLVEKQHLPFSQIGQDCRQVALNLQRRPGCLLKAHVQFVGDDRRQRGLAQSRRAEKQHVVQRLAARLRRFQRNRQLLLGFRLADELPQPARAQLQLKALFFFSARGADQPVRRVVACNRHAGRSVAVAGGCGKGQPRTGMIRGKTHRLRVRVLILMSHPMHFRELSVT